VWVNLEAEYRGHIKEAVVSALNTDDSNIRRAVALCVASMAAIEIPRGEWQDLMGIMVATAQNENVNIRLSSLQTLGFLADELESKYFNEQQKKQIIEAIVNNLANKSNDLKVIVVTLKAFYSALHLADIVFKDVAARDFIMASIFTICESNDEEVQEIAMQILVDLAKTFYDIVQFYFEPFCRITGQFAHLDEERVSAQAIEVWTTIAEEEADRLAKDLPIQGYIAKGQDNLIQLMLECI